MHTPIHSSHLHKARILILAFLAICLVPAAGGAAPQTIPFAGEIRDAGGTPVDRTVDLTISIYSEPKGGLPVWTEIHLDVKVENGRFNVKLGKSTSLSALSFDRPYYVGIQVNDDPELSPRKPLNLGGTAPKPKADARPQPVQPQPGGDVKPSAQPPLPAAPAAKVDALAARLRAHEANPGAHHRQGPGSGLNADLLDGKDSNSFAQARHLNRHLDNRKNPHHVTAAQINTYTRTEVNAIIAGLKKKIAALEAKLRYVTVKGHEMRITGANLHIENGSGITSGKTNGLGNVIIGYNEPRGKGNVRTGSHNLIIGSRNNYGSYGGMVVGEENEMSGPYASVTGGTKNKAAAKHASVTGGLNNAATGPRSSISGGINNTAKGEDDWAAGSLFQNY